MTGLRRVETVWSANLEKPDQVSIHLRQLPPSQRLFSLQTIS